MATPFVTGLAALVKSANPHITPAEVVDLIRQTSTSAGSYGAEFGFGIIDAEKATKKAFGVDGEGTATIPSFAQEIAGTIKKSGEEKLYKLTVSNNLVLDLDGPDGADFDLYVRKGSAPTRKAYDVRGYTPKADESVVLPISGPGEYYIMVRSHKGTGDFKLKARLG